MSKVNGLQQNRVEEGGRDREREKRMTGERRSIEIDVRLRKEKEGREKKIKGKRRLREGDEQKRKED